MKPRRYIEVAGKTLELSKVVGLDMPKSMFVLEELKDGTYRLTYSTNLIPDIKLFDTMTLRREG